MNAELLETFRQLATSRRSIRVYNHHPVSEALIHELLAIAVWSPSAHNRQPWRFVVIQTPEKKQQLALAMSAQLYRDLSADGMAEDVIRKDMSRSYNRITGAPVVICVCMSMRDMDCYADTTRQEKERVMAVQSTAMAGQNLMLAAHAAGLAACWMCAPLFCPEVVRGALQLPEEWEPQGLVTLGFPAEKREKTREPFETRVVWR